MLLQNGKKRINVDEVVLSQDNGEVGKIHIKISYTILDDNNKGEFVFDYSAD